MSSQMPLGIGFMGNRKHDLQNPFLLLPSQMPLGIGFMGNISIRAKGETTLKTVTNASRHWVHGEPKSGQAISKEFIKVTNASRHWVHGERTWKSTEQPWDMEVTNASRHWVHGEPTGWSTKPSGRPLPRHKCLSALGSWGTNLDRLAQQILYRSHKCLSALGSWGT